MRGRSREYPAFEPGRATGLRRVGQESTGTFRPQGSAFSLQSVQSAYRR
ncbi:hypothetical protein ASZ90_010848 [hydrocarbon metagenome]|uniref:Uncharacterized protein n=1 Tax=hydrocarbon metagenome TaxID=938273 RepID=A0A0W8FGJ8_9ZZZZ